MNLHTKKLRDIAYNYIRDIYDNCNRGVFKNTLFVFAGTPQFFDDTKLGIASYNALNDRIEDSLNTDFKDLRKPIVDLKGFTNEELTDIAGKLMIMHEEVFQWNAHDQFNPLIKNIVDKHEENASLTGGKVTPRIFIRSFISVLDTVQQNQKHFNNSNDILSIFDEKESELETQLDDDW